MHEYSPTISFAYLLYAWQRDCSRSYADDTLQRVKYSLCILLLTVAAHADFYAEKIACVNHALGRGGSPCATRPTSGACQRERQKIAATCAGDDIDPAPDKRQACTALVAHKLDGVYHWEVQIDQNVAQTAAQNSCARTYDVSKAVACLQGVYGQNGYDYSMFDAGQACTSGKSAVQAKNCITSLEGSNYGSETLDRHQAATACAGNNDASALSSCLTKFYQLAAVNHPITADMAVRLCAALPAPAAVQSAEAAPTAGAAH